MATPAARYDVREGSIGWPVCDIWTGEPVVIEGVTIADLDVQDAADLAEAPTRLAARGSRG